ncbi:MAG: hypothetical protein PHY08_11045, partial [Candidatus Cloacimonetes bacterium]|nr:hypothetical protein [Candidatus Cloacimonadota bacterium]
MSYSSLQLGSPSFSSDGEGQNRRHNGDTTDREENIDQEIPYEDVPNIEEKVESSLSIIGSGVDIYYADKNQDIYITIKISNPDSYEILSFTLNDKKYTNYMFEAGSNMENLILKVNVGDVAGIIDYTIDAIKYIDGTEIKDVLIDGDKTVKAGVRADDQTYVNVSNHVATLESLSFDANLIDLYDLIEKSDGYAKAVLYDGVSLVDSIDLSVGENNIEFNDLTPNKLYQYAIVALYDDLSGNGVQLNTIY